MKKNYVDKSHVVIKNKEIYFKYEIIETYVCGIELKGTEVKSIRDAKCQLKDSFALLRQGEITLKNMHISPYEFGNINNLDPVRDRKLLLHKNEILKISNLVSQGGYTLIPSKIYSNGRWFKVELCVCRGKKLYDKRETIKERDARKQMNVFKR